MSLLERIEKRKSQPAPQSNLSRAIAEKRLPVKVEQKVYA